MSIFSSHRYCRSVKERFEDVEKTSDKALERVDAMAELLGVAFTGDYSVKAVFIDKAKTKGKKDE